MSPCLDAFGVCKLSSSVWMQVAWGLCRWYRFWFSRFGAWPEILHFWQAPRWCWCCRSMNYTLNSKALDNVAIFPGLNCNDDCKSRLEPGSEGPWMPGWGVQSLFWRRSEAMEDFWAWSGTADQWDESGVSVLGYKRDWAIVLPGEKWQGCNWSSGSEDTEDGDCHGLNCAPPFICWSSNPQHLRLWLCLERGSLKRWLR